MAKATRKDVLYALQFGHERLIKTIVAGGGKSPAEFSLSGSGLRVEPKVAQEVMSDPHIVPLEDGLFPGDSQTFEWREVA